MSAPLLACCLALCGALAVCAAVADVPPPESIPLRAAPVATPVRFPISPPIRATPMFVSTAATPFFFSAWHRQELMRGYYPARPTHATNREA